MRSVALLWTLAAYLTAWPLFTLAAQQEQRVVRGLSLEGNKALDDYSLRSAIATSASGFFARQWWLRWLGLGEKRYFDELEFRRDVVRLMLLYRQSGYMEAVIDTAVRRVDRDVFVTFRISEGQPVRVASLEVVGVEAILDPRELAGDVPLQVGDPFNRYLFQASADTVAGRLRASGYPYAEVLRNFDVDEGARRATVSFEALPGPRSRIETIDIRGTERIAPDLVRRMLSVRPGDLYNLDKLYQSQRDLYRTEVFRYADVFLADSAPVGPGDTLVSVGVRVNEGDRYRVRAGVGYGTIDCFRTQLGWTARDFWGGARTLDVSGRLSKLGVGRPADAGLENSLCREIGDDFASALVNYHVTAALRQPWFFSPRNTAVLSLFGERRSEFRAYIREAIGASFNVTRETRWRVPVTLAYNLSLGQTSADAAVFCVFFVVCDTADQGFLAERRVLATVSLSASRVRVNSPLDPSRGSVITLDLQHASRVVGSDPFFEFNKGVLEIASYTPLGRWGVLAWRVRGGTILPQRITLSGQRLDFVPPEQRFYAGGPTSVRGYPRNELGPRVYVVSDTTDSALALAQAAPTGGNSILVANLELRFATPLLPDRLRLAAFLDAGQLYERGKEIADLGSIRVTPGLGVRIATPLGPVRLDAAYNPYEFEAGPLYLRTDSTLVQIPRDPPFQPTRSKAFIKRVIVQFAVGQAF